MENSTGMKPFSLEIHWNWRLSLLSGGKPQRPLTPKERAQLKHLANRLGAYTREVITFALDNWTKFTAKAELQAGLSSSPEEPHVGFLIAHYHVAVNMMPIAKELAAMQQADADALLIEGKDA